MPEVSVVIPTYNRCEILKRALQSVRDQTFQDFEILVVDDGSTDQTSEYLSSLEDKKIRFFRFETNRGGNAARNEGVKQSRGALIAFLDDDDYWMPQKLERQFALINEENVDLCYTAKNVVGKKRKSKRYSLEKPRYPDLHKSIMYDNFIGCTSTILIKKAVLEDVGGFDSHLPALQDYDVYIRVIKNGYKIKEVADPLIDFQVVDEKRSITCSFEQFKKASDYIINKYQDDPYIHLLKRCLRIIMLKRTFKSKRFFVDRIKSIKLLNILNLKS